MEKLNPTVIWIGYTTLYRGAGQQFKRAAEQLAREKTLTFPQVKIICVAVESKAEFVKSLQSIGDCGSAIEELHFIGHSGMYGIMFGTVAWPEQFSPHEWKNLKIPFTPKARAYFHACRTARWFAPFFAKNFGVTAYGYQGYTTFSLSPKKFVWEGFKPKTQKPLYAVSCRGKKSHGLLASFVKYTGQARLETMKEFSASMPSKDESYDAVAALYAEAFEDIRVRQDEWKWFMSHLPQDKKLRVLDIGCGNGALLRALADRIAWGMGLDESIKMIELAQQRNRELTQLQFANINSPQLPLADQSIDVVISLMSFRYLDWDPIMSEIRRVLAPGGKILILDMVAAPVAFKEIPKLFRSKIRHARQKSKNKKFAHALQKLVAHPDWKAMLACNPMRAEHEYKWYFKSRFPEGKIEILNLAWASRLLAFDSGPLQPGEHLPQSYP